MIKNSFLLLVVCFSSFTFFAQADRWQQAVKYSMNIDMDVKKHQYKGEQTLNYTNNSPDELDKVFYHLFFNAFQPGSMMDVRSRTIEDPDSRVADRIFNLPKVEQGWIKVNKLTMNGKPVKFVTEGTILEVSLDEPIAPHSTVTFVMEWDAQVPRQIRRSGWMNEEGVEYSMTQWYPKMCEYDYEGWHAYPYIGREFYGVWGDFDVNITMPSNYILGFTGILQNPNEIGYGYAKEEPKKRKKKITWKIKAQNVHDFAWAADPDFIHEQTALKNGTVLHFIHQNNEKYNENWKEMQKHMVRAFEFMNKHYGVYPYPKYSFVQGGDGGMEYPMMTLITGQRNLKSLVGVATHEGGHSWYQGVLGTNEMEHAWMDEGFTSFATAETMEYLFNTNPIHPHLRAYAGYYRQMRSGKEEPMDRNSDFLKTNGAYWANAYSKGETFLFQLGYIIGHDNLDKGLLKYFDTWKFKHPNPNDFLRVMEKQAGMELDWYFDFFATSTDTIDYAVAKVSNMDGKTRITLEKLGYIPMPIDLEITFRNGKKEMFYIPIRMMRGIKPNDYDIKRTVLPDWPWVNPTYSFDLDVDYNTIKKVSIDPRKEMADTQRDNNVVFPTRSRGVMDGVRPERVKDVK